MCQNRELYLSEPGLNVVSYTQPPSQVIPMYFQSVGCGRCWQWWICSEKQPLEKDLVFFQQVSWGILCPLAENSFPHASFPGPPAVQRPGRIFSSSAIPLCFRYRYSHTGVNLSMVRTVTTIPHNLFMKHCKGSDSKGSKENSIPNHSSSETGTEFIFSSFSGIPVPSWEGRFLKTAVKEAGLTWYALWNKWLEGCYRAEKLCICL